MKIGVLTSSRADFGIYLPLLKELVHDPFFSVEIIAFGTHLSEDHGLTVTEIEKARVGEIVPVNTLVNDGDPLAIAAAYSDTVGVFSIFWNEHSYDLVLCLGDRYEMNAAVQASIPFQVPLAHFHGGEKTLGAIDNIYRHQISLASKYHFTATEAFADRVKMLLDDSDNRVFAVGSLSLADLTTIPLLSREELATSFQIPMRDYVLCTFHPETMNHERNAANAKAMVDALRHLQGTHQCVVSLPNADTNGAIYRQELKDLAQGNDRITLIESFGKTGYFSAMHHAAFLLGNSSSGIIEAASFGKYVINVGDRQLGRLQSGNVIDVPFTRAAMIVAIDDLIENPRNFSGKNQYVKEDTLNRVKEILRLIGDGKL